MITRTAYTYLFTIDYFNIDFDKFDRFTFCL